MFGSSCSTNNRVPIAPSHPSGSRSRGKQRASSSSRKNVPAKSSIPVLQEDAPMDIDIDDDGSVPCVGVGGNNVHDNDDDDDSVVKKRHDEILSSNEDGEEILSAEELDRIERAAIMVAIIGCSNPRNYDDDDSVQTKRRRPALSRRFEFCCPVIENAEH